ncbi:tRNA lysidine(34) synthetase TilS [Actibacterium sp. MT2.3-13A]|uniref:tRNA lysidine(34) synthetase TilS n=1 Tax=Actibacterium sp. MT2.3-13A TaxID=2828332 RepID=UPI001BA62CE3|nr:tRNA lysidine(34) synthetase TilS [Actibacterium sp. MT2.3-13A]
MSASLSESVAQAVRGLAPGALGVAVSGGGDSMALLHLLAAHGPLRAVTVDHGLRPEAAREAALVGEICAGLGMPHDVLRWHWDGQGNLQDSARRARRRLIADWAAPLGITHVALAHTADDQAETFLMRLAREAGVDGLSGMAAETRSQGLTWLRPVLAHRRQELRDYLRARGLSWVEDPSNENPRFERVRARQALAALAPLGIGAGTLARVAAQMAEARAALEAQVSALVEGHARVEAGDVVIDAAALAAEPAEIRRRFLAQALRWVASADYGPRRAALARLMADIAAARPATVHGCLVRPARGRLRIAREYNAVAGTRAPAPGRWDGRWRLDGPETPGLEIRALGPEGLAQCPDPRASGLPRGTLLATPAVWDGDRLVAAPLAGMGENWRAVLSVPHDSPLARVISH